MKARNLIKNCGQIQNPETDLVHEKENRVLGNKNTVNSSRINSRGIPIDKAAPRKVRRGLK